MPTHVSAVLQFSSGVVGTLLASFEVWDHLPRLEVYGTEGTLGLPDPNGYDGDVLLKRRTDDEWQVLPPVIPPFAEPGTKDQFLRGPGVADLVAALDGAAQRAGAPLACHVLEAIQAIETSRLRSTHPRGRGPSDRGTLPGRSVTEGASAVTTGRMPDPDPVGQYGLGRGPPLL